MSAGTWTPIDLSGSNLQFIDNAGNWTLDHNGLCSIDWTVTYPDCEGDWNWALLGGLPFPPNKTNRSVGVAIASFQQLVCWSILSGNNWINISAPFGADLYSNAGLRNQQLIFCGAYRIQGT